MEELTFMVGGRACTANSILSTAQPRKARPAAERPDNYHRGFSVEGYPPGFIAAREAERMQEIAEWSRLDSEERAKRIRSKQREPKPWNLQLWLTQNKPKKVRAKPYEVVSAADECRALAEKAGWEHVRVVELKKGQAPSGAF